MSDPTATIDPLLLEQLPTLPGTAVEFVRLCDDMKVGVRDVAEVANRDPALVARIVQVANSPFYAPREPVTDVTRAAAILGLRSLKMIGVGFAILGDLWSHTVRSDQLAGIIAASTVAGSGARSFSSHIGTGRDEEAMTAGLLSFVGDLALLRCYPERVAALWDAHGRLPTVDEQAAEFGTDGAELGLLLMQRWNIPEGLRAGVMARARSVDHRLRRSPDVFEAAIGFGTAIAEVLGTEGAIERLQGAARAWGLTDDELLRYWADFRVVARRTNQQMGVDVGAAVDSMIVSARQDYLASQVHAMTELADARREIDELRAENERLEGLSLTDALTGAPNRAALVSHLRACLAGLARLGDGDGFVAVTMFDLDKFKEVNDSQGHMVGDDLLRAVAASAMAAIRTNELFARMGGDEFAMILRPRSIEELDAAVGRVRRVIRAAISAVPGARDATISAGAAMLRSATDPEAAQTALLVAADQALYRAKRQGRDCALVTEVDAASQTV